MTTLGSVALYVLVALALYTTVAGVLAGLRHDRRLARSAGNALIAALGCALVAVAALEYGLITHDFSLVQVVEHTSRGLPLVYTITSLWASQPGSLLLWLTVLTACGALVTFQNRTRNRELMPWVIAVIGGIMVFFSTMTAFVSSPFEKVSGTVPGAGQGLDPSLQNPYMAIHPPMLYLGYVSCAIPFAFAMAALITGRTDARWLLSVRRWTLISWTALGVGMLLGAHWAYVEIGWGGYWAWDPVESAALMPWLAATAFLHSVMVQEKKGMLKVWNMVLVSTTFALALFGTFLTRSGIVNSIHSFVQSSVGPFLLGFIAVAIVFAASLIVWRLPMLRADHKLESVISREATFLFNNLLLLALVFAVIWGVVFPILSDAARGVQATVSSPYYNFFLVLFGLPLLFLIGVGPMIAWRRASPRTLMRTFRWPIISALAATVVLSFLGLASSWAGLTALSLCVFVTVCIGLEFARGTVARRALSGDSYPRAFTQLIGRNRRRYGGYVVHLAVVLLVVGIVASGEYGSSTQAVLKPGQSVALDGYTLTNTGLFQTREQNSITARVRLAVTDHGQAAGSISPGIRQFTDADQRQSAEVDIRTVYPSLTDVYAILQGIQGRSVQVKVLVNPMVGLIWLAGGVFLLGAVITIWPDPREARMLARRYARAVGPEAARRA